MKYFLLLLLAISTMACGQKKSSEASTQIINIPNADLTNESYQVVDIKEVNKRLKEINHKMTPQEVAKLYYPEEVIDNAEGSESITITSDGSKIETTEVTVIHDGLIDENLMSIKHILVMKEVGATWEIISAQQNWRCWKNGPDGPWGTQPCS